ncbi:hypothetical protein BDZ89DRAFT_1147473 [Hymenopellis radicata]|nr:hypothetical protein BDZ89DRAFT_1147473 [Hymenopellis radicata]
MLCDLVSSASDTPDNSLTSVSGATSVGASSAQGVSSAPSSTQGTSFSVLIGTDPLSNVLPLVSALPASASQTQAAAGMPAAITSSPRGAVSLNLVAAAAAHPPAVGASPVVQTPLVVVATSPTSASTVATPSVVTPAANPLLATNHGYPPYQVLPPGFPYQMPPVGSSGPYYAITRGRVVSVIAGWDRASSSCIGIGGAVFRSVPSVDAGKQLIEAALAAGSCMILT